MAKFLTRVAWLILSAKKPYSQTSVKATNKQKPKIKIGELVQGYAEFFTIFIHFHPGLMQINKCMNRLGRR